MKYLVGVDAGTTGITAILYSEDLKPVRRAYREFPQHFPEPGWVEHDADEIRAALAAVLTELLENTTETVVALGITNQRETVFALNRQTGRAFGRGIVWQDRRTRATCDRLRQEGHGDWVRERTGAARPVLQCEQNAMAARTPGRCGRSCAAGRSGVRHGR
ncbi:MAG: FGGY family carbohydrate kinase [Planctomycetota bacterium]